MKYKFGRFSTLESPHVVFPSAERVFGAEAATLGTYLKPLLSVDLARIRRGWSGVAHFAYFESGGNLVECELSEAGQYRVRRGYQLSFGADGVRRADPSSEERELDQIFELDAYEELLDDEGEGTRAPKPKRTLRTRRFVRLASMDLAPPADRQRAAWLDGARAALTEREFGPYKGERKEFAPGPDTLMFAGAPVWLQSDATPRDPLDKPMAFVGQVDASRFSNEIGGMFYLFYAPEQRLVTMVSQST